MLRSRVWLLAVCIAAAGNWAGAGESVRGGKLTREEAQLRADAVRQGSRTSFLLVFLNAATDRDAFAKQFDLRVVRTLRSDPSAMIFDSNSPEDAELALAKMKTSGLVRRAFLNRMVRPQHASFIPNDPYFHKDAPEPGFYGQWHLINEITPGLDAGVLGAWNRDLTGAGVTIGIVDDCIETAHPDLAPNYKPGDSYDFGELDPDPNPYNPDDQHGVSTSGVAAARGGNGTGVTGAAPYAGLAGLRLDWFLSSEADVYDANVYHSTGANPAIQIKNHSYGWYEFQRMPLEALGQAESTAAGTIHCRSAGNYLNDANIRDPQNSPDCIVVAALGSDGITAYYSCYGANVFVTAPSVSDETSFGILTCDRTGNAGYNAEGTLNDYYPDTFPDLDYTSQFGGTSSSSPLVAGVLALAKQAQPNLNCRFAKHLLVKSCVIVAPADSSAASDGGWKTNAAGNKFNQRYGFGLVNADTLTALAAENTGVTPLETEETGTISVGETIPDYDEAGVSRTFTISATTPLEEVVVSFAITHTFTADCKAYLTSPRGTKCRIFDTGSYFFGNQLVWDYTVNGFWGENPAGTWTIQVADMYEQSEGIWDAFAVTMRMGQLFDNFAQTIAFDPIGPKTMLDSPLQLHAVSNAGLPVHFTVLSGPATVSGKTLTLTGAGTVTVRASQPGNAKVLPAPDVDQSFSVTLADQQINVVPVGAKTFGDPGFDIGATATSALPVALSVLSGPATISGKTVALTGAGLVTVRASQAGNTAYAPAPDLDFSFNVSKAGQAIDFAPLPDHPYNDGSFTLNATANSGLPVIFVVLSGPASASGNTLFINGVGAVAVRASQAGDANYHAAPDVERSFNVTPGAQTIQFDAVGPKAYGDPDFTLKASATSALPVSFSVVTGPVAVAGNSVHIFGTGNAVIRALQPGNSAYAPAPFVEQSFTIAKSQQTINFPAISSKKLESRAFSVQASASSGLAVVFSIDNGPAEATGDIVKLLATGTVILRASQPGNQDFERAPDTIQSFTIVENHEPAFVSAPLATPNRALPGQDVVFTANCADSDGDPFSILWDFKDGSPVERGASVTHKFTAPGTYIVGVSVSDSIATQDSAVQVVVLSAISATAGKGAVKFSFNSPGKDSFALSGTIPLPAGTVLNGKPLEIRIADFTAAGLFFDKRNTAAQGKTVAFKVAAKADKSGTILDANAKYALTIKSLALFDKLKSAGFVNENVTNKAVPLTAIFIIENNAYAAQRVFSYSAKKQKGGAGK